MNLPSEAQPLTSSEPRHNELHRCFFAVGFSSEVVAGLTQVIGELKRHDADVRWTSPGNIHLTLRFLGEITRAQLERAQALMDDVAGLHPFALHALGLGAFPSLRAARVFWAGVACTSDDDRARLEKLQRQTERWAQAIDLPSEQRRFHPHITLGRVARPSHGLRALVDDVTVREFRSPECTVDELLLMRSELGPGGSRYEVVKRIHYGNASGE